MRNASNFLHLSSLLNLSYPSISMYIIYISIVLFVLSTFSWVQLFCLIILSGWPFKIMMHLNDQEKCDEVVCMTNEIFREENVAPTRIAMLNKACSSLSFFSTSEILIVLMSIVMPQVMRKHSTPRLHQTPCAGFTCPLSLLKQPLLSRQHLYVHHTSSFPSQTTVVLISTGQ